MCRSGLDVENVGEVGRDKRKQTHGLSIMKGAIGGREGGRVPEQR